VSKNVRADVVLCVTRSSTTSKHICIEVHGRGRPIDSYKTIVSTDDDDGQSKCSHL